MAGLAGLALFGGAAQAEVAPLVLPVGDAELSLGGAAEGALFAARQPGNEAQASGIVRFSPVLKRTYDSGFSWSLNTTLQASDPLSRGRYDGDVLEKAYAETRLFVGTVRLGLTDGAAYDLSVTGPRAGLSLDDAQTTFFADPASGRALARMFALRTPVSGSSNYAKIVVESTDLLGVQVAISFTPSEGKNVLPFLAAGPQVPGRQAAMWEGALRYSDSLGPVNWVASAGGVFARAEHKLPGQHGLVDFGFGLRGDYPVNDTLTLSLGGSWRRSNAYAFDINRAFGDATTSALDVSGGATYGNWAVVLEYGDGQTDAIAGAPRLGLAGKQASLRYAFDDSFAVSTGWQHLNYSRDIGAFYDGSRRLSLNAWFVQLAIKTVP
jgi:hypothetical protein